METIIYETMASHSRFAYIEFKNDKVVFDCSDHEYGPIEFDIEILINALEKHTDNTIKEILKK